jgi:hypothetical protein
MNLNPVGWPGRGLQLFARLFNSSPNSITPVTAISEAPIGTANMDIALVAKGTGATLAQVPDGTIVGGNKRSIYAVDWQKSRSAATQVASGSYSVIGGGSNNTASSNISGGYTVVGGGFGNSAVHAYSVICGGQSNQSTGSTATSSAIAGGAANTISAGGSYAFIGAGYLNTAGGQYAAIVAGNNNSSSSTGSFIGAGSSNTCSGISAVIGGGANNLTNADYSCVFGGRRGTVRSIVGNHIIAACSAPIADSAGVTQSARLLLARETTSATATVLASDSSAASTTNQVILPDRSAYSFSGEVIANVTGGGDTARWTINGAIKRGSGAATTAMVGTPTVTMTHNDAGAAAWVVAVTADTTNGGLAVTVTGAAATTIRWVAKIDTTEVTY